MPDTSEPILDAEILKLARLLRVEPARLAYLEGVSSDDLRALRGRLTETLFGAQSQALQKLVAASRLLPTSLNALLAERAFGPVLIARMAGLIEPPRATEIAAKLPTEFLAEVAVHLDPRQTAAVVAGIPPRRIAEISRLLAERGEFVAMGAAVGQLSADALRAALGALDDEALLRSAFVMDDKENLPTLADLLGRRRLLGMIGAARDAGVEYQAIDLLSHLRPDQRAAVLTELHDHDEESHQQVVAELARIQSR